MSTATHRTAPPRCRATSIAATVVIAAALGFALPTSAAFAAENPIPDPVTVLVLPTAPLTNLCPAPKISAQSERQRPRVSRTFR